MIVIGPQDEPPEKANDATGGMHTLALATLLRGSAAEIARIRAMLIALEPVLIGDDGAPRGADALAALQSIDLILQSAEALEHFLNDSALACGEERLDTTEALRRIPLGAMRRRLGQEVCG